MKNKKDKILIIYDSIDYFIPFMEQDNIDVVRLYKKKGIFLTFLKKMFIFFGWFNKSWYNDFVYNISDYSQIIIFATKDYSIIRYIKNHFNPVINFWYWNPAFRMGLPQKDLFKLADVWSFDPKDCAQYALKFNTTFFFKDITLPEAKLEYDILFLGINKGRRDKLDDLNDQFRHNSLKTFFYIVPDKKEKVEEDVKPIPYEEYLLFLAKSKTILDLQPVGQSGLTLRPMESIFFRKKLITNNINIVDEEFYNSQNIFILGVDDLNRINEFIDTPYFDIKEEIVNKFDFHNWLLRFESNG